MALISQRTNLKSLRYGKDRVGGGSSNQPYVKSPIPDNSSSLDRSGEVDFLLRGGTLTPSRAIKDVSRLTKMFSDTKSPNGLLFTAKQNLLSRTGVKTQASGIINEGAYLPTSTILQAAGNTFGTHLNKQGINPFRNTSPDNGTGSLFGLRDPLGLPVYSQIVKNGQDKISNRLVQLSSKKLGVFLDDFTPPSFSPIGAIVGIVSNILSVSPLISSSPIEILKYGGGPGSTVGVGKTTIRRYSFTDEGKTKANSPNELPKYKSFYGKTFFPNITPTKTSKDGVFKLANDNLPNLKTNTNDGLDFSKNPDFKGRYYVLDSSTIFNQSSSKDTTNISDFRKDLLSEQDKSLKNKNILSKSPDYKDFNIEQRVNLGDPGKRNKNVSSYTNGLGKALDKITAYPLYKSQDPNITNDTNDLVKFRIGIIDNKYPDQKVYIHFRAFLDAMDDNYTAQWDAFKYMGRGENFYRYNGFTRNINLGWTVAAQSKEELIPMYQKLNYLASSLTPDYSSAGYMRGNLATLTVGGYLYEQPGIITSLNYSIPQESPWEIGIDDGDRGGFDDSVKELPHIIKVTGFNFIPIHTFVPRLQQNDYKGLNQQLSKHGKEQYIALSKGETKTINYIS